VKASLNSICVFCGSSAGHDPLYAEVARRVGETLARRGIRLVYGGGRIGLMGEVARAALASGGEVVGVIPEALMRRELAYDDLTELHVVATMHERKALMAERSDGFIALPGGFGTFEELGEMLTWSQLGIHAKPVALLDVKGYYQPLLSLFDHAVTEGFVRPLHRSLVLADADPDRLLDVMARFVPPKVEKWATPDQT
jgi:uncharacterized protein (TIGR00730 family)